MTLRPALIVCIAGLFALPVTTFAADAIDGATSGQRAIQPETSNGGRAITPPTQQRESAPARLRSAPDTGSSGSTLNSSSGSSGAVIERRERFKSDSRPLSDTIEQRRKAFESGN